MPGVGKGLDGFGVTLDPIADDKEGRPDAVALKDVDERLRILIAPGRVEADGDHFFIALHTVDGQLTLGRGDAHKRGCVDRPEDPDNDGEQGECRKNMSVPGQDFLCIVQAHHSFVPYYAQEQGDICRTVQSGGLI